MTFLPNKHYSVALFFLLKVLQHLSVWATVHFEVEANSHQTREAASINILAWWNRLHLLPNLTGFVRFHSWIEAFDFTCLTALLFFSTAMNFQDSVLSSDSSLKYCALQSSGSGGRALDQSRRHAGNIEPIDSLRLVLLLQQRLHLPLLLYFFPPPLRKALLVSSQDWSSDKDLNAFIKKNSGNTLPVFLQHPILRCLCHNQISTLPGKKTATRLRLPAGQTAALGCYHPALALRRIQALGFLKHMQDLPILAGDGKEGN